MSRPPEDSGSQSAAEARAAYEANRARNREARQRRLAQAFPDGDPGQWITWFDVGATLLFLVMTIVAAADPERFVVEFFVLSVVLFAVGMIVFAWVLIAMALRSRDDQLSIAGVFFLSESAPRRTRMMLLGSLAAQVLISIGGAATRPFTPLAVGTLVPLLGLSLVGLWAVRYGHFEAQPMEGSR